MSKVEAAGYYTMLYSTASWLGFKFIWNRKYTGVALKLLTFGVQLMSVLRTKSRSIMIATTECGSTHRPIYAVSLYRKIGLQLFVQELSCDNQKSQSEPRQIASHAKETI